MTTVSYSKMCLTFILKSDEIHILSYLILSYKLKNTINYNNDKNSSPCYTVGIKSCCTDVELLLMRC